MEALDELLEEFLSTPSARRATFHQRQCEHRRQDFYPRPPRGGRRQTGCRAESCTAISIHALREEGDPEIPQYQAPAAISIHALREEGDEVANSVGLRGAISIHALREEGDTSSSGLLRVCVNFYPRPPRGGRHKDPELFMEYYEFLSTPSARRATIVTDDISRSDARFLSTPSARRATPLSPTAVAEREISIHALREEGDPRLQ